MRNLYINLEIVFNAGKIKDQRRQKGRKRKHTRCDFFLLLFLSLLCCSPLLEIIHTDIFLLIPQSVPVRFLKVCYFEIKPIATTTELFPLDHQQHTKRDFILGATHDTF